jgi:hypothetical protein
MSSSLSEEAIREFLRAIEHGEVTLTPEEEPQEVYAGIVRYRASNGWRIEIFNDANEWDYIEEIMAADGRSADFADSDTLPVMADYEPSDEVAWRCYGIPGYRRFRCPRCQRELRHGSEFGPHVAQCRAEALGPAGSG